LLERRGYKSDEIRVVGSIPTAWANPFDAARRVDAVAKARSLPEFQVMAGLFKRVKNITKGLEDTGVDLADLQPILVEPAESALLANLVPLFESGYNVFTSGHYLDGMRALAQLSKPIDRFFVEVLVMSEDLKVREARLALLMRLRSAVLKNFGDISEIAPDDKQA